MWLTSVYIPFHINAEGKDSVSETVYTAFSTSARRYADHPMLHIPAVACRSYSNGALDYSFAAMAATSAALLAAYQRHGFGSGHRVALVLDNRPDFFIHWLALNGLGASVVPVNAELRAEEVAWVLGNSEADLVVALPEHHALLRAAQATLEQRAPIVDTTLLALTTPTRPRTATPPDRNSECAVLYTSGSTGRPKGCLLSNDYFLRMGAWYRDVGGLCTLRPGLERLITPLPLSHMNAMATSAMGMIMTGGCLIQLDRFHPRSWWQTVRATEATVIHYLGVMPAILLGMDDTEGSFAGQVRFGFGAGVNPKHHATFETRYGFPLIEAWAMTETGSGGCIVANAEPRHVGSSCFGKPPATLEHRLVDEQGEDVLDETGAGELLVRATGSNPRLGFFSGYLKNDAETALGWAGGWWHTGDVVRRGADGALHFVDRRKNVIRRSGENIAALEVEATLVLDPDIAEVVVTAAPDELRGDEVLAAVILRTGSPATLETAQAIAARAGESLAYFKVPGYLVFVDAIPRTASQKPQRGEIKRKVQEWLQSPDCHDLRDRKRRTAHAH